MKEPKTVLKHTRTITTYYLSDSTPYEMFKKITGFLESELTLPDSYEDDDVVAVTSGMWDIDKLVQTSDLENSLEADSIPYDLTMEQWNERRQAKA